MKTKGTTKPNRINWDHVYLLGWYDSNGRSYLSSWMGSQKIYSFVVYNCNGSPPIWKSPIQGEPTLELIPDDVENPQEYANSKGGIRAIGWIMEEKINRKVQQ